MDAGTWGHGRTRPSCLGSRRHDRLAFVRVLHGSNVAADALESSAFSRAALARTHRPELVRDGETFSFAMRLARYGNRVFGWLGLFGVRFLGATLTNLFNR
jgi:hypothetical protein